MDELLSLFGIVVDKVTIVAKWRLPIHRLSFIDEVGTRLRSSAAWQLHDCLWQIANRRVVACLLWLRTHTRENTLLHSFGEIKFTAWVEGSPVFNLLTWSECVTARIAFQETLFVQTQLRKPYKKGRSDMSSRSEIRYLPADFVLFNNMNFEHESE